MPQHAIIDKRGGGQVIIDLEQVETAEYVKREDYHVFITRGGQQLPFKGAAGRQLYEAYRASVEEGALHITEVTDDVAPPAPSNAGGPGAPPGNPASWPSERGVVTPGSLSR